MARNKSSIFTVLLILGGVALLLLAGVTAIGHFFGSSGNPLSFGGKIGVIPIQGTLDDSHRILSQIVQFREDNSIRAIVLRVNSPGGRVAPAQEIYREIQRTTRKKRVIVSMGDVAASGGYYVAAAADRIVANPGTILGSIGVIMEFLQVQELLKKAGVSLEVLKSGEFKDIGSPHREMTPRERALMMEMLHDIQAQFIQAVAQGRKIPQEEVERIADGRVFSGKRGKELGLVDQLGNFQDAVTLAKRMTGIQGDVTLVYPEKPSIGLLELLAQTAARGVVHALQEFLGPRMAYRWEGWAKQPLQPEAR